MKYYKVNPQSPTHQRLTDILERMKACNLASVEMMKQVGATRVWGGNFDKAGGAYCFGFDGAAPANWKRKSAGYYPKNISANAHLIQQIEALPTVSVVDWADLFGAEIWDQPGLFKLSGIYYVNGSNVKGEDFEEIRLSEWALAKESLPAAQAT